MNTALLNDEKQFRHWTIDLMDGDILENATLI